LPGNWESNRFNLPAELWRAIPRIGDHDTTIVMHNDAVVQGLGEAPLLNVGDIHDGDGPRQRAFCQPRNRELGVSIRPQ
jgi:hypothetical protein